MQLADQCIMGVLILRSLVIGRAYYSSICRLTIISMITSMIIENRALWLARSFALSRYNHRAVIIKLGTLRSNDADGYENVEKTIGL